ncbi:unnamed protein product [Lepeophtheirus salmonis]|uniref:(salmon louse) hypothetical protein n=1 Tax=Lepeophtheirus salmonis TaxID=72036 RepID=A0A7R8CVT6_LEPSM|nr:unnamed protein product [Lepeophtheirus salmonis]CAF2946190.1 unnamed protein product [Lepeophtheirus salmonis]
MRNRLRNVFREGGSDGVLSLCGREIREGKLREHVSNSHSKEDLLNALFDDSNRVSLPVAGGTGLATPTQEPQEEEEEEEEEESMMDPPSTSQVIEYEDPLPNVQNKVHISHSSLPQIQNKPEVTVTNTSKTPQLIKKTETTLMIFIHLMRNMNKGGGIVDVDKSSSSSKLNKKPPSSPQPCSSRDISQGGFEDPEDEDDITLQDLVALETMEEDCIDEDQYFTLNSNNPLQPYVNLIIHQQQQEQLEQQQQEQQEQVIFNTSFQNFTCEMCGTKMNYFGELSEHLEKKCKKVMELKKLEKSKVALDIPSQIPSNEVLKDFGTHKTSHSSSVINQPALGTDGKHWKCYICFEVFTSGPQLLEHLLMIKAAPFKCSLCHIIFNSQRQAKDHKKNSHSLVTNAIEKNIIDPSPNHNGEYVCDKCDRAFKDKEMLIKHMYCHFEDKPFECSECGKKFSKITLLKCHYKRHFEVEECSWGKNTPKVPKELFCTCGKLFTTQRDLDWHYEAEHENKPKKCKYCGEIFVHNSILTRHIRLKHEENFIPTHRKSSLYAKCPICDQLFYKTSIPKHIRIKHHGQKLFKCDICKRSFTTKHSLVEHQWQHRGVTSRPYKCHICPKAYLRPNLLEAHVNSHKGIKPYVCNECGTKFVTKSNWQRHVQEHSGSRNFECPRCLKKFSRAYYLTDHLKVHTGEKPYSCVQLEENAVKGNRATQAKDDEADASFDDWVEKRGCLKLAKNKEAAFVSFGFCNWKKASPRFNSHQDSNCHRVTMISNWTPTARPHILSLEMVNKSIVVLEQLNWSCQSRSPIVSVKVTRSQMMAWRTDEEFHDLFEKAVSKRMSWTWIS